MSTRGSVVEITDLVEVVVVDIKYLNGVFVLKRVRYRPTDNLSLREINGAFVVSVMQLDGANQWNNPWRIDVVSDLFFNDRNVVTLRFVKEWETTLDRACSLECPPDFIVRWRVEGNDWPSGGQRSHDWNSSVSLMDMEFIFLVLLKVGGDWNRNRQNS